MKRDYLFFGPYLLFRGSFPISLELFVSLFCGFIITSVSCFVKHFFKFFYLFFLLIYYCLIVCNYWNYSIIFQPSFLYNFRLIETNNAFKVHTAVLTRSSRREAAGGFITQKEREAGLFRLPCFAFLCQLKLTEIARKSRRARLKSFFTR